MSYYTSRSNGSGSEKVLYLFLIILLWLAAALMPGKEKTKDNTSNRFDTRSSFQSR